MSGPIKAMRKLLGFWPRTAQEYFERHEECSQEFQFEAAIDDLNEALKLSKLESTDASIDSGGFLYLSARAEEYTAIGQHEKALVDLEECQRRYRDDFGSLDEELASCLVELGEYERAVEVIDKCAREYSLDADMQLVHARCLAGLNRVEEAATAFNQAIAKAEEDWGEAEPLAYFYRGQFHFAASDFGAATSDITRALDGWGDDVGAEVPATLALMLTACRLLSEAYGMQGNRAAAESAEQKMKQWESELRSKRVLTREQVHKNIRILAGVEIAGPMVGLSILLWIFLPTAYRFLRDLIALPPLPGWWQVIPASLLAISVSSLIALVIAGRNNER